MRLIKSVVIVAATAGAAAFTLSGTATAASVVCTPNGNVCADYDGRVVRAWDNVCGGPLARVQVRTDTSIRTKAIPDCGTTRLRATPPRQISYRVCEGRVCSPWVRGSRA